MVKDVIIHEKHGGQGNLSRKLVGQPAGFMHIPHVAAPDKRRDPTPNRLRDTAAVVVQYSGLKLCRRALPMGVNPRSNFLRRHCRTALPTYARDDLTSKWFDILHYGRCELVCMLAKSAARAVFLLLIKSVINSKRLRL